LNTLARIGTGNLSTDLLHGEVNVIDSADADRFALVITAPTLVSMSKQDQIAIICSMDDARFENAFLRAVEQIKEKYDEVCEELGELVTRYIQTMLAQTQGTYYEFEGRRARILHSLILGGLALCRAQTDRDQKETIWTITRDSLSYQRLTGLQIEEQKLRVAHDTAVAVLENASIDALIAATSDLGEKLDLTVANLKRVSIITKSDVFSLALECDDAALRIALRELVEQPLFADEPSELAALVRRLPFPFPQGGVQRVYPKKLIELARMSRLEAIAYETAAGSKEQATILLERVNNHLRRWGCYSEV
jgi:hypothetical protein